MKRRLLIAKARSRTSRRCYFLDEPTAGRRSVELRKVGMWGLGARAARRPAPPSFSDDATTSKKAREARGNGRPESVGDQPNRRDIMINLVEDKGTVAVMRKGIGQRKQLNPAQLRRQTA